MSEQTAEFLKTLSDAPGGLRPGHYFDEETNADGDKVIAMYSIEEKERQTDDPDEPNVIVWSKSRNGST